ncbi:ABC transporter substrate-binding protein [Hathewaya histolytica]|uniref:ABC transporter substrate-binding protein n=1 Tax=Hathewaya histolytica TaxID=1498 RepID=UPI003B67E214
MKNLRKVAVLLLSILLSFSIIACNNKPQKTESKKDEEKQNSTKSTSKKKDGGTLVFSASTDPMSLNPLFSQNRVTNTVNNALFDPLYIFNGKEMNYYLAKDLKVSDDMTTYTITLKDNLKWHDGKSITADDIVFTVTSALDKSQNIRARETFTINNKPVKITKKDDLTVEFKLPESYPPFKLAISSFRPIPKHIFEGKSNIEKDESSTAKPIGSGPYKFKDWKKGELLTLERFNEYHDGKPSIENVVFRVIADSNSALLALKNKEINASYLSDEKFLEFKNNKDFKTYSYDEGMLKYLIFNMSSPNLKKKEVRQAISYALNKDELIKSDAGTSDLNKKAYSVFAPTTMYYTDKVDRYDYNIDKAKEILNKSGAKDITLKFLYSSSKESEKKMAQVIQEQLSKIGIKVDLVGTDEQNLTDMLIGTKNRDYDLVINGYVMGVEPTGYEQIYSSKAKFNPSVYLNKDLDSLWQKASLKKDETERKELYEKIQTIISEDIPVQPIFYGTSKIAVTSNLAGIEEAKLVPIYMFEDLSKLYFTE